MTQSVLSARNKESSFALELVSRDSTNEIYSRTFLPPLHPPPRVSLFPTEANYINAHLVNLGGLRSDGVRVSLIKRHYTCRRCRRNDTDANATKTQSIIADQTPIKRF